MVVQRKPESKGSEATAGMTDPTKEEVSPPLKQPWDYLSPSLI